MGRPNGPKNRGEYNIYYHALGKALLRMRDSEGLKIDDMAEIINIGGPYLRLMESGYACITHPHILNLLTSSVGSRINYVSMATVVSALETIITKEKTEWKEWLNKLTCAVPGLKPLQNFGDNDNENGRAMYEMITNPLALSAQEFIESVADSVTDAIGDKVRSLIKNETQFYLEKTKE